MRYTLVILITDCKSVGNTAKKPGRRRISFRPQPGDSDNEPDDSQRDEDEVEAPGAAEPILSADHIEEDEGPSASGPSSGKHHHAKTQLCAVYKFLQVVLFTTHKFAAACKQELLLQHCYDTCTDVIALMYSSDGQRL